MRSFRTALSGLLIVVTLATAQAATALTVAATIPVGTFPAAMSINSTTGRVYVANEMSNTVSVIDEASSSVVATVPVGTTPADVATDRNTNRVFVANHGSNSVSVIDGATNTVSATIAVGTNPAAISVDDQNLRIYVANEGTNDVTVIDESTNAAIVSIAVGTRPSHMALDRTRNRLFVSNRGSNSVSVIDTTSNTVLTTVSVGTSPRQIAVNDKTARVFVANRVSNTVTVIDESTNLIVGTIPTGTAPTRVSVDKASNRVYVLNEGSASVSVIDGATNLVSTSVATGTTPTRLGLETTTQRLYVVNNGSNDVTVISTSTDTAIATVAVGQSPRNIGIDLTRLRVFVSNQAANTVSLIVEDDTPPHTSITASPQSFSNSSTATFSFRGTDDLSPPTALTFRCSLDGAAATACTSPASYSGLAEGSHTFTVAAVDQAGNIDPTPPSSSWTIDLTPPTTSLLSTPPSLTNVSKATFTFTGADNLTPQAALRFRCRIDGVPWTCQSPATFTVSSATHVFDVAAIDQAGNIDPSPPAYTWTVDASPPHTTLTSTPANPTNVTAASFSFSSVDNRTPASALFVECRLDGAPFAACSSPVSYAHLVPGTHTFQVRATDELGNVEPIPASFTWMIDVQPPVSIITTQNDGALVNIAGFGLPLTGQSLDDLSGVKTVSVEFSPANSLEPSYQKAADLSCTDDSRRTCTWKVMPPMLPGRYHVAARAYDRAGNQENPGPSKDVFVF